MRKSLLKTPPSGLSSRVLAPPALVVGARARARRRAGRRNGSPYIAPQMRVAVEGRLGAEDGSLAERVRLLEAFVNRNEIADYKEALSAEKPGDAGNGNGGASRS